MFVEKHLNKLKSIQPTTQGEVGFNVYSWASYFIPPEKLNKSELNKKFTRNSLLDYCHNPNTSNENAVMAILSWGNMRRDHGKRLYDKRDFWLNTVGILRKGNVQSRIEAFDILQKERNKGNLPGLGIGYYTKLICFLNKDFKGYIMDQWTSKSINLLTDTYQININKSGWVTDENTPEVYENFCQYLEALSTELNCSALNAEERIFSEGRGKGEWRNYLLGQL